MSETKTILITIIVPAHNEADNVRILSETVKKVLGGRMIGYRLLFVDDGSTDGTLDVLEALAGEEPNIQFISFSRNFGHQAALWAGLQHAAGDAVIAMDADLQHPPEMLPKMIGEWRCGSKIVLTERIDNKKTGLFKSVTSHLYYRILGFLAGVSIKPGSADFFLLDRNVVDALKAYSESRMFLRGLLASIGFQRSSLSYVVGDRFSGSSSYSLKKMLQLARDGLLSLSLSPLRLGSLLAVGVAVLASLYSVYVFYVAVVRGDAVPGWASVILVVSFIGAMQLLVLGVIGEYLGQVLLEARKRPVYLIEKAVLDRLPLERAKAS